MGLNKPIYENKKRRDREKLAAVFDIIKALMSMVAKRRKDEPVEGRDIVSILQGGFAVVKGYGLVDTVLADEIYAMIQAGEATSQELQLLRKTLIKQGKAKYAIEIMTIDRVLGRLSKEA